MRDLPFCIHARLGEIEFLAAAENANEGKFKIELAAVRIACVGSSTYAKSDVKVSLVKMLTWDSFASGHFFFFFDDARAEPKRSRICFPNR